MSLLENALKYRDMGLSIIPCDRKKRPLISWLEYQTRCAEVGEIKEWYQKYPDANIGIVTGKLSNLIVVDCDNSKAIEAFLTQYKGNTPSVKTPRGMHYYFKYQEGIRNTVKINNQDIDIRGEGGYVVAPPSINENGGVYKWVVPYSINVLDSFALVLYRGGVRNQYYKTLQYLTEGRRDNDLFHIANCLIKGYCEPDLARQVIEIIANNCNPPFPQKEINAKIQSALERANRKERNLKQEISDWISLQEGYFFLTETLQTLQILTREDKNNASVIFHRLVKEGLIEKYGERRGCYRRTEKTVDIIDWQNAETKEYPIEFPLNIHSLVKIYPGNIVVLAGSSNTGKTSFMLELIRLNQKRHKIIYMNSEMGASELKLRLEMFKEVCPIDQWNFTAIERSDKFSDVIEPDAFNVIDFMEIYDEFWKLGGWLRDIHKKLKSGIAVIAIQKQSSTKKDQRDFGRGGELTIEKPRLYLAMDRGKIKIVKAKIWRNHDKNPNGLMRSFKLLSGWRFVPFDDWASEEEKLYAKHNIINDKDEDGWNY